MPRTVWTHVRSQTGATRSRVHAARACMLLALLGLAVVVTGGLLVLNGGSAAIRSAAGSAVYPIFLSIIYTNPWPFAPLVI
jgi:hypothetical protein